MPKNVLHTHCSPSHYSLLLIFHFVMSGKCHLKKVPLPMMSGNVSDAYIKYMRFLDEFS